jgi:transcriptional regulator with XRE-family HTH domain
MRTGTDTPNTGESGKARVLTKAMLRAGGRLGLDRAQLAEVVGVSESSISRLASEQMVLRMTAKEAQLSALLLACHISLDALVGGNDEQRHLWMDAYNLALDGKLRELIRHSEGLVRVVEYLDRMRASR